MRTHYACQTNNLKRSGESRFTLYIIPTWYALRQSWGHALRTSVACVANDDGWRWMPLTLNLVYYNAVPFPLIQLSSMTHGCFLCLGHAQLLQEQVLWNRLTFCQHSHVLGEQSRVAIGFTTSKIEAVVQQTNTRTTTQANIQSQITQYCVFPTLLPQRK